jgi:hypothetical protein
MGEPLSEVIKIRLTQLKCQLVSHEQELALINRERMDLMNGIVAKNKREAVLEYFIQCVKKEIQEHEKEEAAPEVCA